MRFFDRWFGAAAKPESSPGEPRRYSARVAIQRQDQTDEGDEAVSGLVLTDYDGAKAGNDDNAGYDPYNSGRFRTSRK